MPKALERKLRAQVRRLHPRWSKQRKNAYIYGTLRKTGWIPSHHRHNIPKPSSRGYKKCVISTMGRLKFTTPKSARAAFQRAMRKCRPT